MTSSDLRASNAMPDASEPQERRTKPALHAEVEETEYEAVVSSLKRHGFPSTAEGVRQVLRCFSRFKAVRKAVRQGQAHLLLEEPEHEDEARPA